MYKTYFNVNPRLLVLILNVFISVRFGQIGNVIFASYPGFYKIYHSYTQKKEKVYF